MGPSPTCTEYGLYSYTISGINSSDLAASALALRTRSATLDPMLLKG